MQAHLSFKKHFNRNMLRQAYFSKIGVNPSVGLDKVSGDKFEKDLDDNIKILLQKINNHSYHFTNYRQMLISKGAEKNPREVCIPTVRDKLTINALAGILSDVFDIQCETPQPQSKIDEIIKVLSSGTYDSYIKFDIACFYSSIDHEKLLKVIKKRIRKREILELIEGAITTPSANTGVKIRKRRTRGVPEGLSISNQLANLYAAQIDRVFAADDTIHYIRYVDDILLFCNRSNIEALEKKMKDVVDNLGLSLNDKCKNGLLHEACLDYLGYEFRGNSKITVRESSRRKLERAIEGHIRQYHSTTNKKYWEWNLNFRITGCQISEDGVNYERFGWLFYYSRINDIRLLCHLDWFIKKIAARYGVALPTELKSFKKCYYEMRYKYKTTRYIPSLDDRTTIETKRDMLSKIFDIRNVSEMNDKTIDSVFSKHIRKEARRLKRDIGLIS